MNILEARDTALWQSAAHHVRKRPPKLDPRIVAREHVEGGVPSVIAMISRGEGYYRITPDEWAILQSFDGERSYAEVADLRTQQTGVLYTEEQIRTFAEAMDGTDFFYKAPHEKSRALMEELMRHRRKRRRKRFNLTDIELISWNSDAYFNWLYPRLRFIYTPWFTVVTLLGFCVMGIILFERWGDLWNDSVQYYNFLEKGLTDLLDFWLFFAIVVFFHESAHGLTCRHFATGVHRMGFTLMYFMPTFYCDVSEAWVYARKWPRIAIMFAGCWVELMMCAMAAIIWWGTAPGMAIHDLSYKIMLVAGIAIIVLNLNPLIKLDGYYIFCELIGIPDLMEKSKTYVVSWVHSIFGLPAELDYLRSGRKYFYISYAILAGIYSYVLIFVLVTWTYNIAHAYSPEWAFAPALVIATLVFRAPAKKAVNFMRLVYRNRQERIRSMFTRSRLVAGSVLILLLLFLPLWRDTVSARFLLEAPVRAVVRSEVPGTLSYAGVLEGQIVVPGQELFRLRNLELEADAARTESDLRTASARVFGAQLRYADYAADEQERRAFAEKARVAQERESRLTLRSPIAGMVVTPRPQDLNGSYVPAGTELLEIVQLANLRARIWIPESAMRDVRVGAVVSMQVAGLAKSLKGHLDALARTSSTPDESIVPKSSYKGYELPHLYVALVDVPNPGILRDGMRGEAKIMTERRSIAGLCWKAAREFVARRVW